MNKNVLFLSLSLGLLSANAWAQQNESLGNAAETREEAQSASASDFDYWATGELGAAWQNRNDIEIPKGQATRFSLLDFGKGPFGVGRVYMGGRFANVHEVRALFAPLSLAASGNLKQDTVYMGKTFFAAQKTDAVFRFNSYRLTYRYTVLETPHTSVKLGFTGKIRDAEISLTQGSTKAIRSNVGFVPLLHAAVTHSPAQNLELMFDADALAAPQGRAEDVALTVGYDVMPEAQVYVGYRTVEGGADAGSQDGGGKVYNFTWLNYAVTGMTLRF